MIVTLTCHPALEHTLCLPDPVRGGVNLATGSTLQPGGQGVHVARVLHANGDRVTAVLPCGGVTGRQLAILLTDAMVPFCPVPVAGAVRINTAIVEPDGTTSRYHETGPRLGSADGLALLACTDELLGQASWLAVCGSLPPGLPEDFPAPTGCGSRSMRPARRWPGC